MNEDYPYTSLSIASFGPSTIREDRHKVFAVKNTNCTDDVDGAKPAVTKVYQKPDYRFNDDVDGAKSKTLHHARRNGEDNTLRVDDIDGAQAKIRDKMLLTNRRTNPLEPAYQLPSYVPHPPHEPKFLRDTLHIKDIEGSSPRRPPVYQTRDPISVADIVGAQACWRPRHEYVLSSILIHYIICF